MTLEDMLSCTSCELHRTRTQVVPGHGNPNADIMGIAEAPGAEEDKQGLPLVGPAGKRLDVILERVPLDREEIFLTNVVKCRPPRNDLRAHPNALVTCPPLWLDAEIQEVNPKVIVAFGTIAGNLSFPGSRAYDMATLQRMLPDGRIVVGSVHPSHALRTGGTWNMQDQSILDSLRRAVTLVSEGGQTWLS
ncbi:hypothetical protein LCGC14_0410000 [marine sediment metagenome]|uniref:Uracil-DNA glycosylase-like domain-containing protein n=1 Tax=marine sediment metagenome TaxID=412755 RepID=A0A0F9VG45_9ZZZZ